MKIQTAGAIAATVMTGVAGYVGGRELASAHKGSGAGIGSSVLGVGSAGLAGGWAVKRLDFSFVVVPGADVVPSSAASKAFGLAAAAALGGAIGLSSND